MMYDQYGLAKNSILFFDEAQESKNLANYVKSFKENWPEIQVILTGSSMNRFFPEDTRIPVGRTRGITVFTFNFSEFIQYVKGEELADFLRSAPDRVAPSRHKMMLDLFDRYMLVGGYPEAVIAYQNGKLYYDIIDGIMAGLEEDFRRREQQQPELFRHVVQAVANFIGSPSKLTHFDTTKYQAKKIIEAMKGCTLSLKWSSAHLIPRDRIFYRSGIYTTSGLSTGNDPWLYHRFLLLKPLIRYSVSPWAVSLKMRFY